MELFRSAILRLTAYYLAIVMTLSICFSIILYRVSSEELGRGFTVLDNRQIFTDFTAFERLRQARVAESDARLLSNLVLVNLGTLLLGGGASYLLARRTLRPIQDAMDAQNRFTSDASHELRTPLAAIQTEVEVTLRDPKLGKEALRAQLKSVLEEVHTLRTLSDRLLQLANNKDVPRAPVSLEEVAITAVNRMIPAAQHKHIAIENTVGPHIVHGNIDSLAEVLAILLDNAIKYSHANTTVTLGATVRDNKVMLRVADQGVGIKASQLSYIFDRFYRADSSRTKQQVEGHGLGLSIAKQLVELHNGTISARSTLGKGTVFAITLPLSASPQASTI